MSKHYSPEVVAKLLATIEELAKLNFANKKISELESKVNNSDFNASRKGKSGSLALENHNSNKFLALLPVD
jgi:hypothetical protein